MFSKFKVTFSGINFHIDHIYINYKNIYSHVFVWGTLSSRFQDFQKRVFISRSALENVIIILRFHTQYVNHIPWANRVQKIFFGVLGN